MKTSFNSQLIQFIIMMIVGICFNPMNILAYRFNDLYLSLTLVYSGILMASNMIWAHEIINYLTMGHFNIKIFLIGVCLSVITAIFLLRNQLLVDDNQWLRRMIGHHSTALTTSHKIKNKSNNQQVVKLAEDIIKAQETEISLMKSLIT